VFTFVVVVSSEQGFLLLNAIAIAVTSASANKTWFVLLITAKHGLLGAVGVFAFLWEQHKRVHQYFIDLALGWAVIERVLEIAFFECLRLP